MSAWGSDNGARLSGRTQIPPIATPNSDLTAKNCWYVLQKDDPSSKMAINKRLMTNVHLRPYLSAAIPKTTAPTERKRSVRVMAVVMSVELRSNWMERRLADGQARVKESLSKSTRVSCELKRTYRSS